MTLKLIGAGLGRTGTASVKVALEQLGFGPCYHMSELLADPSRTALWVSAAQGQPDWEAIFRGYVSTVDYPGCSFWRELAQLYPEARVLLSVRDADKWFESTQETIFNPGMTGTLRASPLRPFFEQIVWRDFGGRMHDRTFMVDYFRRHAAEVERVVPAERLLVYDVAQGWEPLCRFLGVPVPDTAFPRVNTREEHLRMRAMFPSGPPDPETMRKLLQQTLRVRPPEE